MRRQPTTSTSRTSRTARIASRAGTRAVTKLHGTFEICYRTGSDLEELCRAAAARPLRDIARRLRERDARGDGETVASGDGVTDVAAWWGDDATTAAATRRGDDATTAAATSRGRARARLRAAVTGPDDGATTAAPSPPRARPLGQEDFDEALRTVRPTGDAARNYEQFSRLLWSRTQPPVEAVPAHPEATAEAVVGSEGVGEAEVDAETAD